MLFALGAELVQLIDYTISLAQRGCGAKAKGKHTIA
jgi:hypothetical protein